MQYRWLSEWPYCIVQIDVKRGLFSEIVCFS